MGSAYLRVLDFDGLSMTGTEYEGRFLTEFDIASQFPLEAIMAEAPGEFPSFIRGDPQDRVIPLHIIVRNSTQTLIDGLKKVFSPSRDPVYLRVIDDNGNQRRMQVKSLGLTPWKGHDEESYVASLEAPEPVWEGASISSYSAMITGSAVSWQLNNIGNERTPIDIQLFPTILKSNTDDFIRRWPMTIAWRSELDGVDSQGLGYPVNITNGIWPTATEVGAGRMQADGDDIRVFVDGVEFDRYLDDINTTGTSVWCSIPFQPARVAVLSANMTNVSPADGASISVSNPEGTTAFPDRGILVIGTEAITYNGLSATAFLDIRRAQRATTAASHTAGDSIWWVEHDIVILTNYSAFASPLAAADRKPILDLPASSNILHSYGADGFIQPDSMRTGQWMRERRGENLGADVMALSQAAGVLSIAAAAPSAGAPNFDALSLYTPCFATGNVVLDYLVGHGLAFEMFAIDEGGFESVIATKDILAESGLVYHVGAPSFANGVTFALPAPSSRLVLHARNYVHTGSALSTVDSFVAGKRGTAGIAQSWTLEQDSIVSGVIFNAKKSAGADGALEVNLALWNSSLGLMVNHSNVTSIPASALSTAYLVVTVRTGYTEGEFPYGAIQLSVIFARSAASTTGTISIGGRQIPLYVAGVKWGEVAGAWQTNEPEDLGFWIFGQDAENQPDAPLVLGYSVQWRNVDIPLAPAAVPLTVIGAAETLYFIQATLENLTTGQTLTITYPAKFDSGSSGLEINTGLHTVQWLELGPGGWEHPIDVPGAVEPTDLADWMYLDPGVNTLRWTEPTMGAPGEIRVHSFWRPRWS